jgi:hypothetical protein
MTGLGRKQAKGSKNDENLGKLTADHVVKKLPIL